MDSMIFLCKYFLVISDTQVDSFLDVLFLLLAVILQSFMRNQEGKIEWQKKVHGRICVKNKNITFLTVHPSFDVYPFFVYSFPLPDWRTLGMAPIKKYSIVMGGILCDDIMSTWSKIWNLLQFNTNRLASLKTWYFF